MKSFIKRGQRYLNIILALSGRRDGVRVHMCAHALYVFYGDIDESDLHSWVEYFLVIQICLTSIFKSYLDI